MHNDANPQVGMGPFRSKVKPNAQKKQPRDFLISKLLFNTTLFVVRLAGIEPTTPWFVAKYSIQLSYSRDSSNYSKVATEWETPRN